MRVSWLGGAVVAVAMLGCAKHDPGGGDRVGGSNRGAGAGASAGGTGATGGSPDFGNTDAAVQHGRDGGPNAGAGGGFVTGDGGICEVGKFCAPTNPDPDNCGTIAFEPDVEIIRKPGNLLIVFDESFSMGEPWPSTGTTKLDAASAALIAALTPLQELVTAGAIFLPTAGCFTPLDPAFLGNAVAPMDQAPNIPFQPGAEFLAAWDAHWANFVGGLLGTPLQEGFDMADAALTSAIENMTLTGSVAVVAFTDGEPNCTPDDATTGRTTQPAEVRAAEWLAKGIKTHVVGLPGANGAMTLTAVAESGGTMSYIDPADPTQLEMRLREVIEETVKTGFNSCSMSLTPVPAEPEKLLMIVEEPGVGKQQVPRDRGWSLNVENGDAQVEISGGLCEAAMAGRFESITFEYGCPDIPPPPEIPPVD